MPICMNCGKEINDEVVYCYDCGSPLCEECVSIGLCSSCEEALEDEEDMDEEEW